MLQEIQSSDLEMHVGSRALLNIWALMAVFKAGTSSLGNWRIKHFERLGFHFILKTMFKTQALKGISSSFCSLGDQSLLFMN